MSNVKLGNAVHEHTLNRPFYERLEELFGTSYGWEFMGEHDPGGLECLAHFRKEVVPIDEQHHFMNEMRAHREDWRHELDSAGNAWVSEELIYSFGWPTIEGSVGHVVFKGVPCDERSP